MLTNANALAKLIFADNVRKGFWGNPLEFVEPGSNAGEVDTDGQMTPEFREWVESQLTERRNFGEALMLVVTEVAEAMEAYRDGDGVAEAITEHPSGRRCSVGGCEVTGKPVGVPSELADIIIRVLDICGAYGVDIEKAVAAKVKYNATRPGMHGRVR